MWICAPLIVEAIELLIRHGERHCGLAIGKGLVCGSGQMDLIIYLLMGLLRISESD